MPRKWKPVYGRMPYTWFDSNRLPSLCVCYVNPRGENENRLGKRKQKFVLSPKWLLVFVCYMILRSVKCNEFLKTTSFPHLPIDKGYESRIKRRFKGIKAMELDFLLDACWDDPGKKRASGWQWKQQRFAKSDSRITFCKNFFPFILKLFCVLCHWTERLTKETSLTEAPFNLPRSRESRMIIEIAIWNFFLSPFSLIFWWQSKSFSFHSTSNLKKKTFCFNL